MVMLWPYLRETVSSASVTVMEHKKLALALRSVINSLGSANAKFMSQGETVTGVKTVFMISSAVR
jgi:hypothetical protein